MFAYDLFLYSQAQLLKGIEPVSWDARGFVIVLMVPLLAIAARRNPQWSLNVFVSRHVVFYTTSFMVIGAYLLLMAFGGYLIRLYGGTWGRAAQLVFFAGAGVVLLALLASSNLRRRLRVFLNKHFYRNKYDYRIEWLRFIQTLSAPEEGVDTRDNAVRAIAQIIDSPGGVLFLRERGRRELQVGRVVAGAVGGGAARGAVAADRGDGRVPARNQWVIDLRELRRHARRVPEHVAAGVPADAAGVPAGGAAEPRRGADRLRRARGAAAAVQAELRGPRPAQDRRSPRRGAPRAVRGGPAAGREPPVRGVSPADGVRDARPQEPGGAAVADRVERREAQAQSGVRRRRDQHDREFDRAHAAADRAAAATRGADAEAARVAGGNRRAGLRALPGTCTVAGVRRRGRGRLGRGRSRAADHDRRARDPQRAGGDAGGRHGDGRRGDRWRAGRGHGRAAGRHQRSACACRWRR